MSSSESDPRFYLLRNAMFDDWNLAESLIAQDPTIIEARSGVGETTLHYLAIENQIEAVKWLLERGADINTRDDFQSTPLIGAASLGHIKLCQLLLNHGADVFAIDHIGRTAVSLSIDLLGKSPRINTELFDLLMQHVGDADINSLFDDLDADEIAKSNSQVGEKLRGLGLKARFDDNGYIQ